MSDEKLAVSEEKFPPGFSKYLCRTCRQRGGIESDNDTIQVRCGNNLVAPVHKKKVNRHKDCPHSSDRNIWVKGSTPPSVLKKVALFAIRQKKKVFKSQISIETSRARVLAYEKRLLRELSRI